MILTGIIVHEYNPWDLHLGTVISKDTHGNMFYSDNFRGICLSSYITKHLEWCMLFSHSKKLDMNLSLQNFLKHDIQWSWTV